MLFKNLIEFYKTRYSIPYEDLADSGESNRIVVHFACTLVLIFAIFCMGLFSVLYFSDFMNHKKTFFYYIVLIIFSIYGILATRQHEGSDRRKNYIQKTIPVYVIMYVVFADAVFTVLVGAVFNGFVVFCITAVVAVCTCSFSPLLLLLGMIISIAFMTPSLYQTFGLSSYVNVLITVALFFCLSLYKRRIEKKHIQFLKKQKQNLEAKTFGNFTLMYENKIVKFARTKSQEMMAYLIYKKGSSVKTKELIFVLYGRDADSARYGNNIRNLVSDIKHTLGELGIQNFFLTEYNNFRVNPDIIKCDYYDFLAGDKSTIKSFTGEFMGQYHWAEEASSFLGMKALEKK